MSANGTRVVFPAPGAAWRTAPLPCFERLPERGQQFFDRQIRKSSHGETISPVWNPDHADDVVRVGWHGLCTRQYARPGIHRAAREAVGPYDLRLQWLERRAGRRTGMVRPASRNLGRRQQGERPSSLPSQPKSSCQEHPGRHGRLTAPPRSCSSQSHPRSPPSHYPIVVSSFGDTSCRPVIHHIRVRHLARCCARVYRSTVSITLPSYRAAAEWISTRV